MYRKSHSAYNMSNKTQRL